MKPDTGGQASKTWSSTQSTPTFRRRGTGVVPPYLSASRTAERQPTNQFSAKSSLDPKVPHATFPGEAEDAVLVRAATLGTG